MFIAKTIHTNYIIRSTDRITTNKTRIISRNQQMMRLDAEITHDLTQVNGKFIGEGKGFYYKGKARYDHLRRL